MTTTAIHPGHSVSSCLNNPDWGTGYTERERQWLNTALIDEFIRLACERTGDDSIIYVPYTSEIQFECWGQTTQNHHCTDPKTAWTIAGDEIDWGELANEASEWVFSHSEDILKTLEEEAP